MPRLMGFNHHIANNQGDINPLRVEDGADDVGNVISEATEMCGGQDVVCANAVKYFFHKSIVLMLQILGLRGKTTTQPLHSLCLLLHCKLVNWEDNQIIGDLRHTKQLRNKVRVNL